MVGLLGNQFAGHVATMEYMGRNLHNFSWKSWKDLKTKEGLYEMLEKLQERVAYNEKRGILRISIDFEVQPTKF